MSIANELRVFISSTFRDLQEEREHLVKKIFPEIRALCRERGITFTEVDLRWGLTEEQAALGTVIRTCLEEVDKCRPYFIGITGERYGYVPELHEYYKDPELLARWPWLEEAAMAGASIIDLEFRHAVLRGEEDAPGATFFFRRERESLDEESDGNDERKKIEALKRRVRDADLPVEEFRDASLLGEMVYDHLVRIIRRDYTDAKPQTPLEAERSRHAAFAASRRRAYIPNPDYLNQLNDWLDSDEPPLVLYAESGSGKSSLVSFWCDQLRRQRPELFIIEHYVGIGAGDSDHLGIIRHIMEEIRDRFDRREEIPSKPEELEQGFANWLGFGAGAPMLVVLDGVNQLSGRGLDLRWLPPVMPAGVRLVISTTVEGTLVDLRNRRWLELGMQPLEEKEREAVVVRFLAEYHKALSEEQIRRIAHDMKCSHPLFLRTFLEELRLDSRHEELASGIERYLRTTGTEDLFQKVLERMEDDYSTRAVREVMSLLWCSRRGLTETELSALTGIGRLKLSTMMNGLDYHLVRRDGVLTFFHDYLRRAVGKRYLTDAAIRGDTHQRLAAHFREAIDRTIIDRHPVDRRHARELCHALNGADARRELADALAAMPVFLAVHDGTTGYDVLEYWSKLIDEFDIEACYGRSIEEWMAGEGSESVKLHGASRVARVLLELGRWDGAIRLSREIVERAAEHGETAIEATGRKELGYLLRLRGEYDAAFAELEKARELCESLGDRHLLSAVTGQLGVVYYRRGDIERASLCFHQQEAISRELGDRRGVAVATSLLGNIYWSIGDYERSLAYDQESIEISRETGDRLGVATTTGNMGNVFYHRGDYEAAMDCHREQERISRELGNRNGLAQAISNMASIYGDKGEYDQAMEYHRHALEIEREIGSRMGEWISIGNMANLYEQTGDLEQALAFFQQAADGHREIGFRYGLSYWLAGSARILLQLLESSAGDPGKSSMPSYLAPYFPESTDETWRDDALRRAHTLIEECEAISRSLSKPDTLFNARVQHARIVVLGGDIQAGVTHLKDMLQNTDDDAECAELHYRLYRIDPKSQKHRTAALRLYQQLLEQTPKQVYRHLIDELTAATEATTQEAEDAPAE